MKNIIIILVITFISCNSSDININKAGNMDYSLIGQGQLHGSGDENIEKSNLVIKNSTSWNELIDKMNSVNNVSDKFTEIDIDFSRYTIIAIFDNIYGNGGHSIDIINVMENENEIIITVDKLLKGDDSLVITQPFHIIKIPKTEKKILFE